LSPFDAAWLAASVRLATPLALAATGELMAETTGVINVGLEGMMLMGAFFSFWLTSVTGSIWIGLLGGAAGGLLLAVLMVILSLGLRADQIVVGIGLNVLALGATSFLFDALFFGEQAARVDRIDRLRIGLLADIPVIGAVLFNQEPLVYAVYLLVPSAWFLLYRTTWGLEMRAAGQTPEAADSAGLSVFRRRMAGTLAAGALAGIGGAFLSIGQLGLFVKGMSSGRGFLALAAVIFGRWNPAGVLAACLVFGAADALQLRLQSEPFVPAEVWLALSLLVTAYVAYELVRRGGAWIAWPRGSVFAGLISGGLALFMIEPEWSFPSALWLAVPPVFALLTLATVRGRGQAPAMLGIPYVRRSEMI
jgi:ABC-type uncharacterized transport system permease subunit